MLHFYSCKEWQTLPLLDAETGVLNTSEDSDMLSRRYGSSRNSNKDSVWGFLGCPAKE